jgi:hypothetical protein
MPASPGESTVHYLLEEFQHSFSGLYLCGLLLGVSLDLFCTACRDNRDHYTDLCDWLRVDLTCRQQQRDINSYLFQ